MRTRWIAVLGAGLIAAGCGAAQPRLESSASASSRAVSESSRTADAEGQGRFAPLLAARIPAAEQLRESERIVAWIGTHTRSMFGRLDQARQRRDIRGVACLDDKLTELDALLRNARDHREQLQLATAADDGAQRDREFRALARLGDRSDEVVANAGACASGDAED